VRAILLLSILVLATPGVASSGSFEHRDVLDDSHDLGIALGTPTTGMAHLYRVTLAAGDRVRATLEWTEPLADLDLVLEAPAPGCALLPIPDAVCLAKRPPFLGGGLGCDGAHSATVALGPAGESIEYVALDGGTHTVAVIANTLAPGTRAGYRTTITVEGAGGAVAGPSDAEYLFRSPECREV
jgi:hypothetical protein